MSRTEQAGPKVTLALARTFDATPEETWAAWTQPEHLARWWHPSPLASAEVHEVDPRAGGRFRLTMRVPEALPMAGTEFFPVEGTFVLVDPPRELRIRMDPDGLGGNGVTVHVRFEAVGARTRMTFHVLGDPGEGYREGMEEGWNHCFDRLGARLTQERADRERAPAPMATVTVARTFDAPPARVWAAWTEPAQLARWFNEAPGGTTEVHELDVRPGGLMRLTIPPDAAFHPAVGSYAGLFLVVEPFRELGLAVVDPGRWACVMVRVRFEDAGGRTRLTLESSLPSEAHRDATASAWGRCLDKLAALVNPNDERK